MKILITKEFDNEDEYEKYIAEQESLKRRLEYLTSIHDKYKLIKKCVETKCGRIEYSFINNDIEVVMD
ncbi:hypothetical protein [Halarcobacter anaerophilus]|uniref:Uncharacterized protein n=1 Tax=Halarcobacter anaerophilus TaxID=877500 RepID=A0A4Q0Y0P5_9BACT|nr:hypothetical protein [Halarcobacter anaerophilus]QDF28962.1 hypothetical protein AANAER_1482 [Halarcobacter anaerophilus]RXJ63597.1 hypothetical protein CRV06_05235 [Halarcobacter anaerophilus]